MFYFVYQHESTKNSSWACDSYFASCCSIVRAPTIEKFFKMCTVRLRFSAEHLTSQKGKGSKSQYKVPCRLIHHVHVIVVMKTSIIEVPSVQQTMLGRIHLFELNRRTLGMHPWSYYKMRIEIIRFLDVLYSFHWIQLHFHPSTARLVWECGAAAAARSRRSRTGS